MSDINMQYIELTNQLCGFGRSLLLEMARSRLASHAWMLNALLAYLIHWSMEMYMIETVLYGCLFKIIFISTTSLAYSNVVVEDGVMLNFVKRNTSTNSFFNNLDLIKVVSNVYSLRFGDPDGLSFTLLEKDSPSSGISGIRIALSISYPENGNTFRLILYVQFDHPLQFPGVYRTLGLFHYVTADAHVLCSLPNPLVA